VSYADLSARIAALSDEDRRIVEALLAYLPAGSMGRFLAMRDARRAEHGGAGPAPMRSEGPEAYDAVTVYRAIEVLRRRE